MRASKRQLVSSAEAERVTRQPRARCADCPWARTSLPGWLGGSTPLEWVKAAHGEERIDCHTRMGAQCVGAAQYRANVSKRCRDGAILVAETDGDVFGAPGQFIDHHSGGLP